MFDRHLLAAVLVVTTIAGASVLASPDQSFKAGAPCLTQADVLADAHRSRNGIATRCTAADLPSANDSGNASR